MSAIGAAHNRTTPRTNMVTGNMSGIKIDLFYYTTKPIAGTVNIILSGESGPPFKNCQEPN